jgi:Na+/melibiose symporter-like transporter
MIQIRIHTNNDRSQSGKPKNLQILRIRIQIHNSGLHWTLARLICGIGGTFIWEQDHPNESLQLIYIYLVYWQFLLFFRERHCSLRSLSAAMRTALSSVVTAPPTRRIAHNLLFILSSTNLPLWTQIKKFAVYRNKLISQLRLVWCSFNIRLC